MASQFSITNTGTFDVVAGSNISGKPFVAEQILPFGLIVSGLKVHYDFANTASYSGTGLILNDISGYGNNTSFSASPGCTFGTEFGGHLAFLGTPDPGLSQSTISLSTLNTAPFWASNPTMTLDYWVKFTSAVAGAQALLGSTSATGAGRFTFLAQTIAPSYTTAQLYVTKGQIANTAVFSNTHTVPVGSAVNAVNIVLTKTGYTYELYINGEFKQSIVDGNSTTYNTGNHNIGNDWNPGAISGERALSKFKGRLYTFRVYDNVLTASQVLQNYNATKARFGL